MADFGRLWWRQIFFFHRVSYKLLIGLTKFKPSPRRRHDDRDSISDPLTGTSTFKHVSFRYALNEHNALTHCYFEIASVHVHLIVGYNVKVFLVLPLNTERLISFLFVYESSLFDCSFCSYYIFIRAQLGEWTMVANLVLTFKFDLISFLPFTGLVSVYMIYVNFYATNS